MPTQTTNYSLDKPLVNSAVDQDLWGGQLNTDLDSIDTLLKQGITITPQSSQTANFNVTASISVKYLYPCDASGGAFAATLPAAATAGSGATVYIKKTDSSTEAVTVTRSGSDTIDGGTTYAISEENQCVAFVSDGTSAWYAVAEARVVPDATTSIKGIVELATAAEVLTGTATDVVATPDALAGNKSLAASGYYKFPGGLIVQWGKSGTGHPASVSFPLTFTTVYSAVAQINSSAGSANFCNISALSTSGMTVYQYDRNTGNASDAYWWIAIGV